MHPKKILISTISNICFAFVVIYSCFRTGKTVLLHMLTFGLDIYINFEVFLAVTMKKAIFWVVIPCGSCKNQCFGGTWHLSSVRQLLVMANIVPSSLILVTLIMVVLRSSETLVLTRATWRNIPKDGILCIFMFPYSLV
jgi:hypothetical protein